MLTLDRIEIGDALPERSWEPTEVSLFLYNAAIWNPHRIHYDEPYTTGVEGHPGVVVDGPLQGDWLAQVVLEWIDGAGELVELEYSNRRASYLGDRLTAGGTVVAVDRDTGEVEIELAVRNREGEVTTPGRSRVRLGAGRGARS
ncbi:MAG: hypothetical protein R3190_05950 [Thermoanaerobaculia bacterium]|nr:hypothetical protein [Thermoanaerobaculia bacterium]